jgi:hypothetical protein
VCVAAYLVATPILREAELVPPWLMRASLLVRQQRLVACTNVSGMQTVCANKK